MMALAPKQVATNDLARRFLADAKHVSPAVVQLGQATPNDGDVNRLEEIAGTDAEFTLRLLALANSAFYSQSHEISSLRNALVVLGSHAVQKLASSLLARSLINDGTEIDDAVWRRSIAVGVTAQMLAETHRRVDAQQAYVAGLLHNIGEVALHKLGPAGEFDDMALEARAALGGDIADLLGLSKLLASAIRNHHRPHMLVGVHKDLATTVFMSRQLVDLLDDPSRPPAGSSFEPLVDTAASVGLLPSDLEATFGCIRERVMRLEERVLCSAGATL